MSRESVQRLRVSWSGLNVMGGIPIIINWIRSLSNEVVEHNMGTDFQMQTKNNNLNIKLIRQQPSGHNSNHKFLGHSNRLWNRSMSQKWDLALRITNGGTKSNRTTWRNYNTFRLIITSETPSTTRWKEPTASILWAETVAMPNVSKPIRKRRSLISSTRPIPWIPKLKSIHQRIQW